MAEMTASSGTSSSTVTPASPTGRPAEGQSTRRAYGTAGYNGTRHLSREYLARIDETTPPGDLQRFIDVKQGPFYIRENSLHRRGATPLRAKVIVCLLD